MGPAPSSGAAGTSERWCEGFKYIFLLLPLPCLLPSPLSFKYRGSLPGMRLKGTISQCISTFHKGSVIWEVLAGPVITTGNNRAHKGNGVWTIIHIC